MIALQLSEHLPTNLPRDAYQPDSVVVCTVTPEMAARWLKDAAPNRRQGETAIRDYRRDMTAEQWALNGEALKFSGGRLVDGQHRLEACVRSGEPFQTFLIGIDDDAVRTLDSGRKRTTAHALQIDGFENAAHVCAIAGAVIDWIERGQPVTRGRHQGYSASKTQIREFAEENYEKLHAAVLASSRAYLVARRPTRRLWGAMWFMVDMESNGLGGYFFDEFCEGTHGAPEVLRRKLVSDAVARRSMDSYDLMGMLVFAYNAWHRGEKRTHMKAPSIDAPFPPLASGLPRWWEPK